MRAFDLKGDTSGKKCDPRNVVSLVEPGGFPEGVSAVVTRPGLGDASTRGHGRGLLA